MDKKVLQTRTLTGIVFGAIMLAGLLINQTGFMILTTLICAGCLWEYYAMVSAVQTYSEGKKIRTRIFYFVVGMAVYLFFMLNPFSFFVRIYLTVLLFPILFLLFAVELFLIDKRNFQNITINIFGLIYIVTPLSLLHHILTFNESWFPGMINPIVGIVLLIWTNDTFAYLTGAQFGKHKMFPEVSPKKSWEGFVGGTIMTLVVAWLLSMWLTSMSLRDWIALALIASIIGTIGDLFESMIKRNLGIKDSGNIMPGHGGFLDRFDAFIFCIPFVFAYL
ncbi:MAG: phosphatidate cytidylyltransferase, partial [Bacteroidota bacterium]